VNTLHKKKGREEHVAFVVEGYKLLSEAIQSGALIKKVYSIESELPPDFVVPKCGVIAISPKDMGRISALVSPSPILAIVEKEQQTLNWDSMLSSKIVVLDGIRDPGNLGTIIRTCDWFGITDIVVSEDTVDVFNGKVIQSTMGSFFRTKVHYTNLESFFSIVQKKDQFIPVYGAVLGGKLLKESLNKDAERGCLIVGSESHGISASVLEHCTDTVTINGSGNAESLNAAISASIILYEWCA
jgi:TrmH family RNA methyltransferase